MDKISKIIPPSTRQVLISGEIEKPKRVADPTPEERMASVSVKSFGEPGMGASSVSEVGPTILEGSGGHKGSRLNMMA